MRSTAGLLESFSVIPTYWLPCPGKRNALVVIFTAEMEKLLIFVPRADTVSRLKLNKTDFENHILRQRGGDMSTSLISSNGKMCAIDGDIMTTEQGYKEQRSVRILFEECFYNSRDESYQVFCLEQPLEGATTDDAGAVVRMESLDDCTTFLWRDPVNDKVKRSVDDLLELFQMEHGGSLRNSMDAASAAYTRAVQEVWKGRRYQAASQKSFCKLAVEVCTHPHIHVAYCLVVGMYMCVSPMSYVDLCDGRSPQKDI
jgi:hypothetical protein